MKVRKAVIPVAGKGTRFLPATKEIPKEMLPLVDKPCIHYAVEEAVKSGIEQIIFVTASGKQSIEDYFDRNIELESFLERNKKMELRDKVVNIGSMIEVVGVRQKQALGLGHAILSAESLVGDEPFAVILADDLVVNAAPVTKQLIEISTKYQDSPVIGVMEIPREDTSKYGVIDGKEVEKGTYHMEDMVEKPSPENAPSNLATPGRYILTPDIFSILRTTPKGVGGEYQLTDAIQELAKKRKVYAHLFEGDRYDTGSVIGYLRACVDFSLADKKYGKEMEQVILEAARKINERK